MTEASFIQKSYSRGLRPDPLYDLAEWSDQFRVLSSKASAEPGKWRTDRTPYLRKIMSCLSSSSQYERIVFMKGSQIGASECAVNWLGYIIDKCPAPVLIVQPTVDLAKKFSKQRLEPLLESTECLHGKIMKKKSRDSDNTMFMKGFEGGVMLLAGSNSASGLRSMPIRFAILDEVDAYPDDVDGEGSAVDLAIRRTATFSRRKIFMPSTPTIEGMSKIAAMYEQTDQNKFFVPCPDCNHFQTIEFENLTFDRDAQDKPIIDTVKLKCVECQSQIPEYKKTEMLARGEWRALVPSQADRKVIGFHLNSLYSPVGWYAWGQAVKDYHDSQNNSTKLKTFVNTVLGETWKEKGDAPDWRRLYDRREDYPIGIVPAGGCVLTAGVDVQKDRLEVMITAWGRGMQSWMVEYRVLRGDTSDKAVWDELGQLLFEDFHHENGYVMRVTKMLIDSGFNTQSVYRFVLNQSPINVATVKGSDTLQTIISNAKAVSLIDNGIKRRTSLRLHMMGSSTIKHEVFAWLRADDLPDSTTKPFGFAHFPQMDVDFFKGLASEQLIKKKVRGYDRYYWTKVFDRNEPLDTFVMNRAAAHMLGLDRWKERRWDVMEGQLKNKINDSMQLTERRDRVDTTETNENTETNQTIAKEQEKLDNKPVNRVEILRTRPRIKRRPSNFL